MDKQVRSVGSVINKNLDRTLNIPLKSVEKYPCDMSSRISRKSIAVYLYCECTFYCGQACGSQYGSFGRIRTRFFLSKVGIGASFQNAYGPSTKI